MSKKTSARSRSRSGNHAHWYPAWVYHVREDITLRNMDLYDRQQERISARCLEINPDYHSLPFPERMDVYRQARQEIGLYC